MAAIFSELWEPLNYFTINPLRKKNIGMLCMQESFFWGGLITSNIVTDI